MELHELRAEARRLERLSKRKLQRLDKKGISLDGTGFSALRDNAKIDRYTRKQLNTYISRLSEFNARRTSFVRLGDGSVTTGAKWRAYKSAERKLRRKRENRFKKIQDNLTPYGMTVGERTQITKAPFKRNITELNIYQHTYANRSPESITTLKALDKLEQRVREMSSRKYDDAIYFSRLESTEKMLYEIGDMELLKEAKSLNKKQFNYLWLVSQGFAADVASLYELVKTFKDNGVKNDSLSESISEGSAILREWIDNAKQYA